MKPVDRLKAHAANHPALIAAQAQIKATINGVVYHLDEHGWWWMQPTDNSWPQTPLRVTDPDSIKRIEDSLDADLQIKEPDR